MNLTQWQPYRQMEDFFDRYNTMFSRPLGRMIEFNGNNGDNIKWSPAADISETDKEFLIKAELPEVKRKDVRVSVSDGVITITGERKMEKKEKDETIHRVETYYGKFSRSFTLPENVNSDKVTAESKDGVLRVHLPKMKVPKAKKIEVAVE